MKTGKPLKFLSVVGVFALLFVSLSLRDFSVSSRSGNKKVLQDERSSWREKEGLRNGGGLAERTTAKVAHGEVSPKHNHTDNILTVGSPLESKVILPSELLQSRGRSTARAALETELYALSSGNVDLLATTIQFDPLDRGKIVQMLSSLPGQYKSFDSPEKLVAFLFMGGQRIESLMVLEETPLRDGVVVQHVRFKFYNDNTVRDDGMVFINNGEGWKFVCPAEQVQRIVGLVNRPSDK